MTTTTRIAAIAAVVGGVLAAATSASAALNLPTQNCAYTFTTNMKRGTRSQQVMDLQKVLNMYPQTTVALSGAGSMGKETMLYGAATAKAVAKFQELHAADTLAPIGAKKGTGNVFSLTRAVLNQICTGSTSTTTGTTTPTTSGNVSVSLAANQPSTVLVAGQATARLADFTFTGNGTVNALQLMRTGVSSNDTLKNVYLFDKGMRIAGPSSPNTNGTITFSSASGLFTVSGMRTLTVRSDIAPATNGQSIGVNVTGFTVAGGTMATLNVAGVQLPVAAVNLLTADFPTGNSISPSVTAINAGTMNQTIWTRSLNIGTRAGKLHGITVKMIGSAPMNSITNVKLVVDGVQAATGMVDASGFVYFDTSANPVNLTTGSHLLEVRADIVSGANRNFYISMEQSSDLRIEDTQVIGAFVTATVAGVVNSSATNLIGGTVTINNGTLTITQDTSFNNVTTLVGGASNVKMAAFKFTAYGEDTKVTSLTFTPTISGIAGVAATTLTNVGLYINGGQVGSNQAATTATALTFANLGSNLTVPAGQTVIVEIRGDAIASTSVAYTAGSVAFNLAAGTNNAQGIVSSQLTSTSPAGGQSLTISGTNVTIASTAGFAASTKAPNTQAVKIGSFTVQTGSAEGITVTNLVVGVTGTMITGNQITNLTVKDGTTVVGNTIGNPTASNNFSANVVVPVSSTKVFDVYADFGSNAAGTTAIPSMTVTYRGASSNLSATYATVPGITTTANVATMVAGGVTFNSGLSPVSQLVIGGSSLVVGQFNFKASTAVAGAIIKDVTFTVPANTVSTVAMNGKTGSVVGTTATIFNVGATVPADASGVNLPVTLTLVCAGVANGCFANSPVTVSAQVSNVTYFDGVTTQTLATSPITNNHFIVASKPTLTVDQSQKTGLVLGAENKIGEVTIAADVAGQIKINTITFALATSGITGSTFTTMRLADGNTTISGTSCTVAGVCTLGTTPNGYTIAAGGSKTFSLFGTNTGSQTASTVSIISSSVTAAGLSWDDVSGGAVSQTGTNIFNFPTASYSVRQ